MKPAYDISMRSADVRFSDRLYGATGYTGSAPDRSACAAVTAPSLQSTLQAVAAPRVRSTQGLTLAKLTVAANLLAEVQRG
jgi:hypothetical protein